MPRDNLLTAKAVQRFKQTLLRPSAIRKATQQASGRVGARAVSEPTPLGDCPCVVVRQVPSVHQTHASPISGAHPNAFFIRQHIIAEADQTLTLPERRQALR